MVKESHDRGALSSIALLQERFRQLQRMKELRQERELLRMLSESERHSSPPISHTNYQQKTFPGSQSKSLPQCQLALSLWPDSQNKHGGSQELGIIMEGPSNLAKSWLADATQLVCTSPVKFEQCGGADIDTSLRL